MAEDEDHVEGQNHDSDEDLIDESEIDDAQFEDPPDFVDSLTDKGTHRTSRRRN